MKHGGDGSCVDTAPSEATETAGVFVVLGGHGHGAPSKDRTCDLGFRKTSGSEPGFDTGRRNRSGFYVTRSCDHSFSSPVAPPLPSSTIAARRSFAVMSA